MKTMAGMDSGFSSRSFLAVLLVSLVAACPAWGQASTALKDRIAGAREQRNEAEIERLVIECETRWNSGERKQEILDALYQIAVAIKTWKWNDFHKQQQLPQRVALFALERGGGAAALEAEVRLALTLCVPPDPQNPANPSPVHERGRRAALVVRVLHRVLAKVDPSVDLSFRRRKIVLPLVGTSLPAHRTSKVRPSDIKDPAHRAEFERRIRQRNLEEDKKGEQMQLRVWEKWLITSLETYLTVAYSLEADNTDELDQLLSTLTKDQNSPDLEAMSVRIKSAVRTARASRPA